MLRHIGCVASMKRLGSVLVLLAGMAPAGVTADAAGQEFRLAQLRIPEVTRPRGPELRGAEERERRRKQLVPGGGAARTTPLVSRMYLSAYVNILQGRAGHAVGTLLRGRV